MGDNTRRMSDYQSQYGPSKSRGSSFSVPLSQPTSRQPSWPQFSIPTTADSLSSGFNYDNRLQQLQVTPSMWKDFTFDILSAARLTFEEDKKAWGAGIATGTASTFAVLFLGPVAGYYAGKAVHKRTVVEKARERMMEDGKLSNALRTWNEGAWAKRGFHTWIEFPEEGSVMNRADAKRFRIAIIPGSVVTTQLPMSSQIQLPTEVELQGSAQYSMPPGPVHQNSMPQIYQPPHQSPNQPIQQTFSHPPPAPSSFPQQPTQQTFNSPPPPPSAPSFHQQTPPIQQINSNALTQPPQNPSAPQFYSPQTQQQLQQQYQTVPTSVAKPDSNPPQLPARVSTYQELPGNQVYEAPNTEAPTLFELPADQSGTSKPVHYYEMDGESARR